jgi:hypothetical protein
MEEWWNADPLTLQSLFEQHQMELNRALLEGGDWKDVQDKREMVTQLSILLFYRSTSTNPAEFNLRDRFNNSKGRM